MTRAFILGAFDENNLLSTGLMVNDKLPCLWSWEKDRQQWLSFIQHAAVSPESELTLPPENNANTVHFKWAGMFEQLRTDFDLVPIAHK